MNLRQFAKLVKTRDEPHKSPGVLRGGGTGTPGRIVGYAVVVATRLRQHPVESGTTHHASAAPGAMLAPSAAPEVESSA